LEANSRLPDGNMKILRRVTILHELGKHRDCVELMANIDTVARSHQLFGLALVLAVLSADVMARDALVEAWRDILRSGMRRIRRMPRPWITCSRGAGTNCKARRP
jgi:hypothetical protein